MSGENLDALLADAVAAEAARQRVADRALRQAAAEEATFAGLLVDLAERGTAVGVQTAAGRLHRGSIRTVGRDFAVVQDGEGRPPVFVPLRAITSVRLSAWSGGAIGDRRPPLDASLAAVLGGLAAGRPRVQVGVAGADHGAPVAGDLVSAGRDVLTVAAGAPAMVVIPLSAVSEVVLLDSV